MKKLKKIILCLTLGLMIFMSSLLNVDALTNLDIRGLENKIPRVMLMPNFSELDALDDFDFLNFACEEFTNGNSDYIIGWEDEETKNGPIFKIPADVFEEYILSYFDLNEEYVANLGKSFSSFEDSIIHDCSYFEENGNFYYQYSAMTGFGIGSVDSYNFIKGYEDLGDNYYKFYYYQTYNIEYLGNDYKLPDDAVLGVDYIERIDSEGNLAKYEIENISSFTIYHDGVDTKFYSYLDVAKSEVPSDDELILYNPDARKFLDGAEQKFDFDNQKNLSFRIDMEYNLFDRLYINKKLVDPKHYTVKSGSTIITFSDEFTKSLGTGEHILEVMFKDNSSAITKFKLTGIKDNVTNPNTNTNVNYGLLLLLVSFAGVFTYIFKVKKVIKNTI